MDVLRYEARDRFLSSEAIASYLPDMEMDEVYGALEILADANLVTINSDSSVQPEGGWRYMINVIGENTHTLFGKLNSKCYIYRSSYR